MNRENKKHLSKKSLSIIILVSLCFFAAVIFNFIASEEIRKNVNKYVAPYKMMGIEFKYDLPVVVIKDVMNKRVRLNNIVVEFPTGKSLAAESLVLNNYDFENLKINLRLYNFDFPLSMYDKNEAPPIIKNYLEAFEYAGLSSEDSLIINLVFQLDYEDKNLKTYTYMDVDKLLNLDLVADLGNVELNEYKRVNDLPRKTNEEKIRHMLEVQNLFSSLEINKLNLVLEDKGLADGIVKVNAQHGGISEEQARHEIVEALNKYSENIKNEGVEKIINELVKFMGFK